MHMWKLYKNPFAPHKTSQLDFLLFNTIIIMGQLANTKNPYRFRQTFKRSKTKLTYYAIPLVSQDAFVLFSI